MQQEPLPTTGPGAPAQSRSGFEGTVPRTPHSKPDNDTTWPVILAMAVGLALVTVVLAVLVLKRRKHQTLTSARN